jgi:hypothetical protein
MVQGRRGLCLPLKAGERLRVAGDFFGQELESHKAVEPRVFSLVDHTHATAAELVNNAVVRDSLADHGIGDHESEYGRAAGDGKSMTLGGSSKKECCKK